jgi:subtilisin-like proprotein convertase family protein
MSIEPDNKDWTWVLDQPCPDCAYDASRVVPRDIGLTIREIASQWDAVLVHPQCVIRPRPEVWSALEYGCHVRDVFPKHFNGTSSACPVVSGVTALLLQANSSLKWRDVKEIYIRSATKNDPSDSDWVRNGAGFSFNHKYGAGLINASDAVRLAKSWSNLGTMTSVSVALSSLPATIRDNNASGLVKYFDTRSLSGLRVEHATITTDITHASRGELEIQLTSPDGTTSRLAEKHTSYAADPADYPDWTFSTVHNWGEDSRGLWKLKIADRVSGNTGTLNSATLTLYGTAK